MVMPVLYSLYIPFGIYNCGNGGSNNSNRWKNNNYYFNIIYYWIGFILYYILGPSINLIVNIYTLYYLDDLNWNGKQSNNSIEIGDKDELCIDGTNNKKGFDYTKKIKFKKGFLICSLKYLKEDDTIIETSNESTTENSKTDNSIYDNMPRITIPLAPVNQINNMSNILNLSEIENYKHNRHNNNNNNRHINIYIDRRFDKQNKDKFSLLLDELKSKTLTKLLKPTIPTIPSSSKLDSPTLEQPDIDVNQMWDSRSI
jgi:hypothetical protein